MNKHIVSIVRYEKPLESVAKAVALSRGLDLMPARARVFLKPNIVFWTKAVPFPKWGVVTTSRVVEDMVVLLKERGINDITIGEGSVLLKPKDMETPAHAFRTLGYESLQRRYGVKCVITFERPFEKVNVSEGITLNIKLTHQHIANMVGISRETVTRVIDKWQKDKEITVLKNRHILLHPDFLSREAQLSLRR